MSLQPLWGRLLYLHPSTFRHSKATPAVFQFFVCIPHLTSDSWTSGKRKKHQLLSAHLSIVPGGMSYLSSWDWSPMDNWPSEAPSWQEIQPSSCRPDHVCASRSPLLGWEVGNRRRKNTSQCSAFFWTDFKGVASLPFHWNLAVFFLWTTWDDLEWPQTLFSKPWKGYLI